MIYQRTQPAEVIALLMEALRHSIELEGSASSSASRGGNSNQPRGGAILEEIDTEESATSASSNKDKASSSNGEESQGQTHTSSPEARSYVDVDYPSSAASNA